MSSVIHMPKKPLVVNIRFLSTTDSSNSSSSSSTSSALTPLNVIAVPTDTPMKDASTEVKVIETYEELQPQWVSLERRLVMRRLKKQSNTSSSGRSVRRPSGWDAENV